jgi:hypothetical protein
MDIEKVKAQIEVLRQRRMSLPELTDYRPQRGKAKTSVAAATPVSDKSAEDIFSNLFVTPAEETTNGEPSTSEPATGETLHIEGITPGYGVVGSTDQTLTRTDAVS